MRHAIGWTLAVAMGLSMGLASSASAQTAHVQIIHDCPDPTMAAVDIYFDSTLAAPNLAFRESTAILSLDAGEVQISIGPAGGPLIPHGWSALLAAGGSYVVVAAGVFDPGLPGNPDPDVDTEFDFFWFDLAQETGTGSDVDLLVFHGAPDAPSVDVVVAGNGNLAADLPFGRFAAGYTSVSAENHILNVTRADDPATVVGRYAADLSTLGGGAAVVFASGFLSESAPTGTELGLFAALADGTVLTLQPLAVAAATTTWGQMKSRF